MSAASAAATRRPRLRTLAFVLLWLITLAAAFRAGAWAYKHRARLRALITEVQGGDIIETNLYNLRVTKVAVDARGRDGGIAPLGSGILFVNRLGMSWFVDSTRQVTALALRVPVNYDEFAADPYNTQTNLREQFAVKDILVQPTATGVRLLASYNHWFAERDCYVLRVGALETTTAALVGGDTAINSGWHTVFESTPCRPLTENPNGVNRNPTLGAGGRIVSMSERTFLLTVGGFGPESLRSTDSVTVQSRDNTYGKTILVDLASGEWRIYTIGHRNPQGLTAGLGGDVWETEHAARGGDELNRIVDGRNYGYPLVSYGTEYEAFTWRSNPRQGHHDGFEKPTWAWVPSIGVSQAAVVTQPLFANWYGDILVSSLRAQTLFRVQVEDGRTVFAEPIPIGHRVRDIVEAADGTLVLKTDDNFLVFIQPITAEGLRSMDLTSAERGQVLSAACAGCHALTADAPDGIGPNLWGLVGRPVAARSGYRYSDALRRLGGRWDRDRLRRFVSDPDGVAPGTAMQLSGTYTQADLDDLMAYLETLR